MFSSMFYGVQQDVKLALLAPLFCAVFRLIFILAYAPDKTLRGNEKKWIECFRYGFWWGMDYNAYVFLVLFLLVTVPGIFFSSYYTVGNYVRITLLGLYMLALYIAFSGRMIFYYHFHDIFNPTLRLGGKADKKNLMDIFFNQNHGILILAGIIPYLLTYTGIAALLIHIPLLIYPQISSRVLNLGINIFLFIVSILFFYWCRYGGTLNHRKKPEWDTVPEVVKNDIFFGKATYDDFINLKNIYRQPVHEILNHSDEESEKILEPALHVRNKENILHAFRRFAEGARITKPKHIFFIVGESYTQAPFDEEFSNLHIVDNGKRFRNNEHTFVINNFLPAGMISQPAITSLISGIFDCNLEINERQDFRNKPPVTSLPAQLSKLGYKTVLWYGGSLSWSSIGEFSKSMGFDVALSGNVICAKDAPKTWLGVYDHIFLDGIKHNLEKYDDEPSFHFIYTTSNHGPYTIPIEKYGINVGRIFSDFPESMKRNKTLLADLGTYYYVDWAQTSFIEEIKKRYADSLIVVTGDHSRLVIPLGSERYPRKSPTVREMYCTSFAMYHQEIKADMFTTTRIGGHMNIIPTLFELIAPEGYEYYALMPSFFEKVNQVVTPYHWLTDDRIGYYGDRIAQYFCDYQNIEQNIVEFEAIRNAYSEVTGWYIRHCK